MKIVVDAKTMDYSQLSKRIIVNIHAEISGHCYPGKEWSDFLCILGHWYGAVRDIRPTDKKVTLNFMDGPHQILLSRSNYSDNWWTASWKGRPLPVEGDDGDKVLLSDVISQLRIAASGILSEIDENPLRYEVMASICESDLSLMKFISEI